MRIAQDLRGAFRAFRGNPSVTTLVVLAFGLGIGITTAVFSIFNGVVLAPLPYPDPQELVMVYDTQPACATCPASFPKYHDWKTRNRVFAAIGGSTNASFVLTGAGSPQQLIAATVTASLGDVFRVPPVMGRWFTEQEDQPGGPKVTVLSHHLWTQAFGSNPNIIGQRVTLDGDAYEVVGVMPSTFNHRNADLFVPLQRKLDPATRGSHFLVTYARLKKGVTPEQAAVEMRALGRTLAVEFGHNHGIDVRSYYEVIVGSIRGPLHVLLGAVFLVLLIACANVANLLLASGLSRRRELAIRLTLGARQRDIARQLTIEALVLAAAGGALGLLLAHWTVRIFLGLADNALPRAATVQLDGRVVAFAALLSLVVGLACGLWPLLRLRARELTDAVRAADTRTASGGRQFGNGLVVVEIALAFALLVGAGLLMKNLVLLLHRDAGIRTDHIVAFDLSPAGPRYQSPEQVRALYREVYARLSSLAGVQQAGFVSHLPMYRFGMNGEFSIEGGNPWGPNDAPLVEYRWYYGNYLGTLGIPLLRGRLLDSRDGDGTQTVLINQAMADKFWPGRDPIGKRFGQGSDASQWYEVVGVVGNVRSYGLASRTPYEFYRTLDQDAYSTMTGVIRTSSSDPESIIPNVRSIVSSIDPSLPLARIQTMDDVVAASVGQPRLLSALTTLFGGLAGLLAMLGIYGVMAYNVRRQRREFGIRLALGADPRRLRRLVVGRGLLLAAIGVAIGAFGAWTLTGVLGSMLNDVKPSDPSVFVAISAVVLLVATAATWPPARQAARVDPTLILRDL